MAPILDTPQWRALTVSEKDLINSVSGNDLGNGFVTRFTKAARRMAEGLEARGLIAVQWDRPGHGQATVKIRDEEWGQ